MASVYYVFSLDVSGSVAARRDIEGASDNDALETARELLDAPPQSYPTAEVWSTDRKVGAIEASKLPRGAPKDGAYYPVALRAFGVT